MDYPMVVNSVLHLEYCRADCRLYDHSMRALAERKACYDVDCADC